MAQRQLYSGLDLYDWRGTGPNGRTKAVDVDKWQQNQEDVRHLPGAFPVQSVVITDGQITPTAAALSVDTEGGAPADDLTAIAPGDLHAGMLLALCSLDDSRKITIKNSAGDSGIQTLDGKDVTLDTRYAVMLRLVSTESLTLWREEPGPLRLQLTVSTPDTLGGVKVQTGPEDGLELETDGKLRVRKASATQRGSVLASTTAAANTVPQAGADGTLDASWVPTGLPLGHIFAWPFSTAPDGCIILNGSTYDRTLYADFFAYIKSKGWTKTETEWQAIAQANNGFCPWYSEGDGSTNFRTPKFAPYMKLAITAANTGKYYEAGLPDFTIVSKSSVQTNDSTAPTGTHLKSSDNKYGIQSEINAYGYTSPAGIILDASVLPKGTTFGPDTAIYGGSNTVQPESHDWIICAVAFGTATNVGSVDVANVMSAVNQVQAEVSTKLEDSTVHITETWKSSDGSSWYRKWGDGFIEQGGTVSSINRVYIQLTVTFPTKFTNANSYVCIFQSAFNDRLYAPVVISKTATSIRYDNVMNYEASYAGWYACGY